MLAVLWLKHDCLKCFNVSYVMAGGHTLTLEYWKRTGYHDQCCVPGDIGSLATLDFTGGNNGILIMFHYLVLCFIIW